MTRRSCFVSENQNKPQPGCISEASEYKIPLNCDSNDHNFNCEYYASWTYDQSNDAIDFVLKVSFLAATRLPDQTAVLALDCAENWARILSYLSRLVMSQLFRCF